MKSNPLNIESHAYNPILPGLNPPVIAGRVPSSVSHMDGLRFEFADESWLLLRPSAINYTAIGRYAYFTISKCIERVQGFVRGYSRSKVH